MSHTTAGLNLLIAEKADSERRGAAVKKTEGGSH